MHDESLGQAIVVYLFDNDDMYRRHFMPTEQYMRQNPRKYNRVQELVDNVCMSFAKENIAQRHLYSDGSIHQL